MEFAFWLVSCVCAYPQPFAGPSRRSLTNSHTDMAIVGVAHLKIEDGGWQPRWEGRSEEQVPVCFGALRQCGRPDSFFKKKTCSTDFYSSTNSITSEESKHEQRFPISTQGCEDLDIYGSNTESYRRMGYPIAKKPGMTNGMKWKD